MRFMKQKCLHLIQHFDDNTHPRNSLKLMIAYESDIEIESTSLLEYLVKEDSIIFLYKEYMYIFLASKSPSRFSL